MYFITTKRMLEVCFSAHPNIQYRTCIEGGDLRGEHAGYRYRFSGAPWRWLKLPAIRKNSSVMASGVSLMPPSSQQSSIL